MISTLETIVKLVMWQNWQFPSIRQKNVTVTKDNAEAKMVEFVGS